MMTITQANLVAYSAQVALVALVGGAVLTALRVQTPHIRYGSWRVLLALCLALPWLQTPRLVRSTPSPVSTTLLTSLDLAPVTATTVDATPQLWTDWIGPVLLTGVVLRLVWIGIGCLRLQRLRRRGELASDPLFDDIARAIGARAEIRYVPALSQPVMFGLSRPVILLPERLRDAPADIRQAVAAHELWHVRRRDWLWLVGEELVRAALWFQPVIWWLIARIRASREEVVDGLSIAVTGRRQSYVRALVAFADVQPLAGAATFGWRRHLFQRIVQIGREEAMSSQRLVGSLILLMFVVALSGWYAVSAFPLTRSTDSQQASGPGPIERLATRVSAENPLPRQTHDVTPVAPDDPAAREIDVTLLLRTTIDQTGAVAEARVVRASLRMPTARNVASPDGRSLAVYDGSFIVDGDDTVAKLDALFDRGQVQPSSGGAPLVLASRFRPVVRTFVDNAITAVRQWQYAAPEKGPLTFDVTVMMHQGQVMAGRANVGPVVTDTGEPSPLASGAIRVGGEVKPPVKITDVRPIYPDEARAAGIQGVVVLEVRIEPDGRVGQARILRSIPVLDEAAIEAVRQWQFQPTLLNGVATPVVMTVTVQFSLG